MLDTVSCILEQMPVSYLLPQSPLAYPLVVRTERGVRGRAEPEQPPPPLASATAVAVELLDRAVQALDDDLALAQQLMLRASALLKGENAGADDAAIGAAASRSGPAHGGLAPWQMRRVTKFIDDSLAATIRTRDCASIAQLSSGHFARAFKHSFGETCVKYVTRRRTERARELMVMTDRTLCDIALDCGFADQSHFSRQFRQLVGATPAAWRRQRREGGVVRAAPDRGGDRTPATAARMLEAVN